LCLAPAEAQIDEVVTVLESGDYFYVLRAYEDATGLVGDAYIHGLMHGEALEIPDLERCVFRLM
jgi:hypothetical protein